MWFKLIFSLTFFVMAIIYTFFKNIKIDATTIVLVLMIWMGLMCLIKLKKADFYHDRENKMWILRVFILFAFLTSGLLTGLNLYYEASVQTIIVGFFFFVDRDLFLQLLGIRVFTSVGKVVFISHKESHLPDQSAGEPLHLLRFWRSFLQRKESLL